VQVAFITAPARVAAACMLAASHDGKLAAVVEFTDAKQMQVCLKGGSAASASGNSLPRACMAALHGVCRRTRLMCNCSGPCRLHEDLWPLTADLGAQAAVLFPQAAARARQALTTDNGGGNARDIYAVAFRCVMHGFIALQTGGARIAAALVIDPVSTSSLEPRCYVDLVHDRLMLAAQRLRMCSADAQWTASRRHVRFNLNCFLMRQLAMS